MIIFQVLMIIGVIVSANGNVCSFTSWMTSFDSKGQSKCQENNHYIRGLERNDVTWNDDPLDHLEGVECCSAPTQWSNVDMHVIYADWTSALDQNNAWVTCPTGYFLQGLFRSDSGWPRYKGYLNHIENGRCAKPSTHPTYYGDCYDEDVSACFDKKGRCSCKPGHYVTGLYRGNDDDLYNLDKLRCCTMAQNSQIADSPEAIKNRIIDTTLWKMATLADMLGFGWCNGNRAVNVGEDFERNGDIWQASTKLFWPNKWCEGEKCDQRLNLAFGDWSLSVKEIKYGQSVPDDLHTETIDTGTIHNNQSTDVTETFEITKNIQTTITHSTTSSWTNSHELGFSLNLEIPGVGGASTTYTTKFEYSTSTVEEKSTQNARGFAKKTEKTLKPFSSAKYNVIMYKSRTTIPYTAVIIAKFSTELRGFLRWAGGHSSQTTNYHYQHKGSAERPNFNYRFGSSSVPFYTALKKESESRAMPWLWNEIFKAYPSASQIINSLTDEAQYQFTLSGTLAKVSGTKIDVIWESVNVTRREAPVGNETKFKFSNETIIAGPGPNDPPAKVQYPVVDLVKSDPVQFQATPIDTKSA